MTLVQNTATGDGGGIVIAGDYNYTSFYNTIIAQNSAATAAADDCLYASVYGEGSADFTLVGNGDNCSTILGGSNNQVGNTASPVDPIIGNLQDNGGPTYTHALLAGSPAIDAGGPYNGEGDPSYDQRGEGYPRLVNDTVDLGAYEYSPSDLEAPQAYDDEFTVLEGATLNGNVTANNGNGADVVPDGYQVLLAGDTNPPAHATSFELNTDGSFTYIHDGTQPTGDVSFQYVLLYSEPSEGIPASYGHVTIHITSFNDVPTISSISNQSTPVDTVLGPINLQWAMRKRPLVC